MSLRFRGVLFLGFLAVSLGCFYLLGRAQAEDAEFLRRTAGLQAQLGSLTYQAANLDRAQPAALHTMGRLRDELETALRIQRPDLLESVWKNLRDDVDMLLAEAPVRRTLMEDIATLQIAMNQAQELSWRLENIGSDPWIERRAAHHQLLIANMEIALAHLREDGNTLGLEANLVELGRSIHQLLNEAPSENAGVETKEMARDQLEDLSVLLREHAALFRHVIQQSGTFVSFREVQKAINHGTFLLREELTAAVRQLGEQVSRRTISLPLVLNLLGITSLALALLIIELLRIARVQANRATRLQKYRRQSRAAIGEISEAIGELVGAPDHPMALRHDRYGDIVEAINELLEARGKRYTLVSAQAHELSGMATAAQEATKGLLTLTQLQQKNQRNSRDGLHEASRALRQTAAEARSFGESLGRIQGAIDAELKALSADGDVLRLGMKGFAQAQTVLTQSDAPLHRLHQLLHEMGELTEACNILAINAALLSASNGERRDDELTPDIEHIQSHVGQISQGSRKAVAELEQMQEHGLSVREITRQNREKMATHSHQNEERMDTLQTLSSRMRSLANQSTDLLRAAETADQAIATNDPATEAIEETAVREVSDWLTSMAELAGALQTDLRELHTLPNQTTTRQNGTRKHVNGGTHHE